MAWDIIGWGIIACLVLIFIVGPLLRLAARWLLWFGQRGERGTRRVERYDSFVSVWGGPIYRVNNTMGDSLVVSSVANNMGGWHVSRESFDKQIAREKLIRRS